MIIALLSLVILLQMLILFFCFRLSFRQNNSFANLLNQHQSQLSSLLKDMQDQNNTNVRDHISSLQESLSQNIQSILLGQQNGLDRLYQQNNSNAQINENKLNSIRETIDGKLAQIRQDNEAKLEQVRLTVDEKLHSTLEKRLGESFKVVSERLEMVYRGLGEMNSLAAGVGDLKKVLSNVKTRGIWGEIQLEALLEQIMTPEQYQKNAQIKAGSADRVEFAIKLPGKDQELSHILLPIDAKFPLADYQKLIEAQENSNREAIDQQSKLLEYSIKKCAKLIHDKYIFPPYSTDFALMFLPIEGLYAEILRYPGLVENIQSNYRVIITGPTTLSAIINSLQMGFRTLAIEKRSSDVWRLLEIVKSEFTKFSDLLGKTRNKIEQAGQALGDAENRSRLIQNRLQKAEKHNKLPNDESNLVS